MVYNAHMPEQRFVWTLSTRGGGTDFVCRQSKVFVSVDLRIYVLVFQLTVCYEYKAVWLQNLIQYYKLFGRK